MLVVFLTNDLVFPSRVAGVVQRLGARMETAATAEVVLAKLQASVHNSASIHPHPSPLPEGEGESEPVVVLIDLNSSGAEPAAFVPKLKALEHPPQAIVAFGPHVHEVRLTAAQAAGCDVVLTRGQFDAQMKSLLAKLLQTDPK